MSLAASTEMSVAAGTEGVITSKGEGQIATQGYHEEGDITIQGPRGIAHGTDAEKRRIKKILC